MILTNNSFTPVKNSDLEKIILLMTNSMREDVNHAATPFSVNEEYPLVFEEENRNNIWGMKINNIIVTALAAYPYEIKIFDTTFKAIGIGSVCTHSLHRKMGYSTRLHLEVLKYYNQNNFDFAILWTNLFDYYRKINYESIGFEIVYPIEKKLVIDNFDYEIIKYSPDFYFDLYNLYKSKTNCPYRSKHAFKKLLAIPNMDILCATRNNKIVAYTIRGKGSDLRATIHEWAGDINLIPSLINKNLENEGGKIFILANKDNELEPLLLSQNISKYVGPLGMIRILDPINFFKKIDSKQSITIKQREESNFNLNSENFNLDINLKDISRLCFGSPNSFDENLANISKEVSEMLPLPLFFWGLDSV